jgi:hypothetical protein
VVLQVDCRVTGHRPCGSGEPSETELHRPSDPDRLQALQAPLHALLQHTPWAQNPDPHSVAALHSKPGGLRPQEAALQKFPATHWLSLLQAAKQTLPLQTYGLQAFDCGSTH